MSNDAEDSRNLLLYLHCLPFAIYPVCGPFFTLPATIGISYSLMGIEDIGVQLEEPFNILPLRQMSDGVYSGVDFVASVYSNDDKGDTGDTNWHKGIL